MVKFVPHINTLLLHDKNQPFNVV